MKTVELYNNDCLEVMDDLIKNNVKIDAIITDPPYGTTACSWDAVIPFEEMWKRLNLLIKPNGAIVLFGSEPFSSHLRMSNIKMFRYDIIWNKVRPSNFQMMNFQVGRIHETISIFSQKPAVFCKGNQMNYYPQKTKRDKVKKIDQKHYGSNNSTVRNGNYKMKDLGIKYFDEKHPTSIYKESNANIKNRIHPTQKPIKLMEYLIKTYTNENEIVLDFTMGSGTTGIACLNTNRKFIGIEKDDKYFKLAKNRIENHKIQQSLF